MSQSWFSPGDVVGLGQLLTFKTAMERNLFSDSGMSTSFTIQSKISWDTYNQTRYETFTAWNTIQTYQIPIFDIAHTYCKVDTSGVPRGNIDTIVVPVNQSVSTTVSSSTCCPTRTPWAESASPSRSCPESP